MSIPSLFLPFSTAGVLAKYPTGFPKTAKCDLDSQFIYTAALYSHGFYHYTIIFRGKRSLRVTEKEGVQLIINQNLRLLGRYPSFGAPNAGIVQHFSSIVYVFP